MSSLCILTEVNSVPAVIVPSAPRRESTADPLVVRSRLQDRSGEGAYLRFTKDGPALRHVARHRQEPVLTAHPEIKRSQSQAPFGEGAYLRFTKDGNALRNAARHG